MKVYELKKVDKIVVTEVKCDRCGQDCFNTYMEILKRWSFSEKPELIETICWDCYDKFYKDKAINTANDDYSRIKSQKEAEGNGKEK